MKKILTFIGAALIVSTVFTSCGGGKDSASVTVDKVNINGDSKEYIEVVPGSYEIKKTKGTLGEEIQIGVKFKTIKPLDSSKISENTAIGNIGLKITDQGGSPFDLDFSPADGGEYDKLTSLLKGKAGDEVTVLFKPILANEEIIAEIIKNAKGFEITSADITNPKTEDIIDNSASSDDDGDDDNDSSESASTSNGDCESFCNDYEAFVDEYVAFMKKYKANPSDPSMLAEYSSMMSKAASMQDGAKNCTGDAKVAARMTKIAAKLAKAAM